MSIQEELSSPDRNIGQELDDLENKAQDSLEAEEFELGNYKHAVGKYFSLIRYAHAFELIDQEDMENRLSIWSGHMITMSRFSPHYAFFAANDALNICMRNENGLVPCDIAIANAVFVHVSVNAIPAINAQFKHDGYFSMEKARVYMRPLMNVLVGTSQRLEVQSIQDTFFEALSHFDELIASNYVHPVTAFEFVKELQEWAKVHHKNGALAYNMKELMQLAVYLPDGTPDGMTGTIPKLNFLELKADPPDMDVQSSVVDMKGAFARKAGINTNLKDIHHTIETSLDKKRYQDAENALYALYYQLGQENANADGTVDDDLKSYVYFFKAAERLGEMSDLHGAHLAEKCMSSMDDDLCPSEMVTGAMCEFALSMMMNLDVPGSDYRPTAKEIYKKVMKWSSEFEEVENTDQIFDCAEQGFVQYLVTVTPEERYAEIQELATWLEDCVYPSPYLQEFVQGMLETAVMYEQGMGIPFEEDEVGQVIEFRPGLREVTPP